MRTSRIRSVLAFGHYAAPVSRSTAIRFVLGSVGSLPFISWSLSRSGAGPGWLDRWFAFQCHGLFQRSLALGGSYFPVCSRCLGIYGGVLLAAAVARPRLDRTKLRGWLLGAAALMVIEVIIQERTGHRSSHSPRLLTGLLLAWPVVLTVLEAAEPNP